MTSKELVAKTIRGENPVRTPVYAWVKSNLKDEISAVFGSAENFKDHYEFDMAHIFGGPRAFNIKEAKWICAPEFKNLIPLQSPLPNQAPGISPEHPLNLTNYHMLIRKTFDLKLSAPVTIDISGDDYYKLYINGRFAGQGPAPAYHDRYYYNSFDITEFLQAGKNVIAVHLYYQGILNKVWCSGDFRQGMAAVVSSPDKILFATDDSWKCYITGAYSGETFGYHTQFVENIDARLIPKEWNSLEFDDCSWEKSAVKENDDHILIPQPTPVLSVYEANPIEVKEIFPGHYFVDFGEEKTGQIRLKVEGKPGDSVEVLCGEELTEEGSVRYKTRCACNYSEVWTLSGGREIIENYDYKAFRYAEIISPPGTILPEGISAIVRHYPFNDSEAFFESSNILLNNIWDICKNGVKYGIQEGYLDCPSREKGQFLGDMLITAKSQLYLTGDTELYRQALRNFAHTLNFHPGMCHVAPMGFITTLADYSLMFGEQVLTCYEFTGDKAFLAELYPAAERVMSFFKGYARADGLLENVTSMWNLVDWPKNLRDGYDFDLSQQKVGEGCHNVINAFYIGAIQTLNRIKTILGMPVQDTSGLIRQYYKVFFRKETGLFADSEISKHSALHSNALPLYFGIVKKEDIPAVINFINQKGLCCGVYFAYFVLNGLAKAGEYQMVFELLTGDGKHSWGNMVKQGATTCFEVWGKEQKWNTSLCHPWGSAPISVFIERIAGFRPNPEAERGFAFSPNIPENFSFELKFPYHQYSICIKADNGKADLILKQKRGNY